MPLTNLQSNTASSLIQQLLRQLGYDENAVANSGSWSGYNGLEAALAPMVQQLIGGYSDQALQSNMNYDGDLGEYTGLNSAFSGGLLNQLLGTAKSNQTVQGFLSNKPTQDYKRTTTPGGGANGGPLVGPGPTDKYGSTLQGLEAPTNLNAGIGAPTNLSSSNTPVVEDPNVSAPTIIDGVLHIPPSGGSVQTPGTQTNTGGAPVANQNTPAPGDVMAGGVGGTEGMGLEDLITRSYRNAGVNPLMWYNQNFQRVLGQSNDLANLYKLMNPNQYDSDVDLVNKLPSLWGKQGITGMVNNAPLGTAVQNSFATQPELVNLVARVLGYGNSGIAAALPNYIQGTLLPEYKSDPYKYTQAGQTTFDMLRQILSGQFSGNLG